MPEYTDNLKLFKYNTETDGKEVFSINEAMNHNWDILDKQPGTLKTNQITNCLTEVPQRIKVELNDGALTLKTGSVIIVPYGTSAPTMEIGDSLNGGEIVDISWDGNKLFYFVKHQGFTITRTGSGYQALLNISPSGTYSSCGVIHAYSGTTAPSGTTTMSWYDTGSNIVKRTSDSGTTWENYYSLPFIIVTYGDGVVASIDNVFNGFGFIGSTIWCDKGVKGLAADGRNSDGSLKNVDIETELIILRQTNYNGTQYLQLQNNSILALSSLENVYFEYDGDFNDLPSSSVFYDSKNNITWSKYNNILSKVHRIIINITQVDNLKVTSFGQPKQPFRAVDYNDTEFIAHQAMPSDSYIELATNISTGTTFTARADGYVFLGWTPVYNNNLAYLQINIKFEPKTLNYWVTMPSWGRVGMGGYVAVSKGFQYTINFLNLTSIDKHYFIYAQGAQPND